MRAQAGDDIVGRRTGGFVDEEEAVHDRGQGRAGAAARSARSRSTVAVTSTDNSVERAVDRESGGVGVAAAAEMLGDRRGVGVALGPDADPEDVRAPFP